MSGGNGSRAADALGALPAGGSERARVVFAALVDFHDDGGIYLDATSKTWPVRIIAAGERAMWGDLSVYMLEADGALSLGVALGEILARADEIEGAGR